MKRIARLLVLSLFACTVAFTYAFAQEPGEMGEPGAHKDFQKGDRIFKELKLTKEQQRKLKENRQAQRKQLAEVRKALQEKRTALDKALKDPAVTRAQVEPIVGEIKTLQARLTDLRMEGIFAVKSILTPEQFAKFQQKTEERMHKWQEGRQHGKENH